MSEDNEFLNLLSRVQAQDQRAVAELVQRYGPALHRAARVSLFNPRLRRLADSEDFCQLVWKSFFQGVAGGLFPVTTPEQLMQLLKSMLHNKLVDHMRRQTVQRRDQGKLVQLGASGVELPAKDPTPSAQVTAADLAPEVRIRLSGEERRLLEMRDRGQGWAAIALELGGSAEALRKKLERALERVSRELQLLSSSEA
jgi:DNA-directed RNA polymerase specialized sigma24 family protein